MAGTKKRGLLGSMQRWLEESFPPTWSDLYEIGSSKIVNSSFIWMVLLPIIARALTTIESKYQIQVQIPLNFYLLYVAALVFAAASTSYHLFCPKLVQRAPNYGVFVERRYSINELKKWYRKLCRRFDGTIDAEMISHFITHSGGGSTR